VLLLSLALWGFSHVARRTEVIQMATAGNVNTTEVSKKKVIREERVKKLQIKPRGRIKWQSQ
jgi:hypothetical protein